MDRIVLEVPDFVAKAWRAYPEKKRVEMEKKIADRIAAGIRAADREAFFAHLEKGQQMAAANGLTEEILDQLLREDD